MASFTSASTWNSTQAKSLLHWGSVFSFGLIIYLGYQNVFFLIGGFILFLLVTSLHMVWKMIVFIALISIALLALPFLAPIVFIIMVILFFLRIGYVIENWRPIVLGLLLYGSAVPLFFNAQSYYYYSYYSDTFIPDPIFHAFLGIILLHFGLVWVYRYGYSTKTALGIMGSVPLVILAFILPFLKLHIPAPDVVFEPTPTAGGQLVPVEPTFQSSEVVRPLATGQAITSEPVLAHPQEVKPVHVGQTMTSSPEFMRPSFSPIEHPFVIEPAKTLMDEQSRFSTGSIQLQSNVFGGLDYIQDGTKKLSTQANVFGGQDVSDSSGQRIASSQPNVFNGETVVNSSNQTVFRTHENVFNGHDIYDKDGGKVGYTSTVNGNVQLFGKDGNLIGTVQNDVLTINR